MQYFIGVGSNLGNRQANLEAAGQALAQHPAASHLRAAPLFSTPALLPPNAPTDWNIPYLNSVIQLDWADTPQALLHTLQNIERALGRTPSERWAPRLIDLDILLFGTESVTQPDLQIPHAGLTQRSFVLDPLLHLAADLRLPNGECLLPLARSLPSHAPLWMGIMNLTPDSFSDGGTHITPEQFAARVDAYESAGVQIFDLGAESTRPDATPLTAQDEWARLEPALTLLQARYEGRLFRPQISVDTYRASTAEQALTKNVSIINDVSGLTDPAMLPLLQNSDCTYVLMHSLSIPADRNIVLTAQQDPVRTVHDWAEKKLDYLVRNGISRDRIIFDLGIGFGKTPQQSLTLLQHCDQFFDLPVRLMIGHSRKSFMSLWSNRSAAARDPDSIGVSLQLAHKGVDLLRVHAADQHLQAWHAYQLTA